MTLPKAATLAALIVLCALPAAAQDRGGDFFGQLDANGDGTVDQGEFSTEKGAVLYGIDDNRDLKIQQSETRMTPQAFRQYAGGDDAMDAVEFFEMPETNFQSFDSDSDQRISRQEFRSQMARLRAGPQAAER